MPHDYVRSVRKYRSPDGKYVTRQELRKLIDKLTAFTEKEAARIARSYSLGNISLAEFEAEMRTLLKSAHIVASSVGRGGRALMTQSDWGRVGAKIKWQYTFLSRFAKKIASGRISKPLTASRARSYASAIYISFSRSEHVAKTERVGADDPGQIYAELVQNSKEGCVECTADAADGPQPVEDVALLGDRLCGDFCLCTFIFTDAQGNEV